MSTSESNPPSFEPPSFQPKRRSVRPSSSGATRIGSSSSASPAHTARSLSEKSSDYHQRRSLSEQTNSPRRVSAFQAQPSTHEKESRSSVSQNPISQTPYPPSYAPRSRPNNSHRPTYRSQHSFSATTPPADTIHSAARHQSFTKPQGKDRTLNNSRIKKRHTKRRILLTITALLALIIIAPIAWGIHLYNYGNTRLTHVDALSGAPDTPGTTYLIVGSDQREANSPDPTAGMRSDTIMLLHKPASGTPALVSLPRDAWVEIPDNGEAKLNAAFSWGGPQLLVRTVENLTGFTIDHYVQIGMSGVKDLTNAVGGVNLCLDYEVNDPESELVWPPIEGAELGCFDVNGDQALAFSRMRKADPLGDIGRTNRQRQVVGAILHKALTKDILLSPSKQKDLVGNTAQVLTVDTNDSIANVGFAGLALRDVMGDGGLLGAPPIADMAYWTSDGQSAVLLDPDKINEFWAKMAEGTLTPDDFYNPQL